MWENLTFNIFVRFLRQAGALHLLKWPPKECQRKLNPQGGFLHPNSWTYHFLVSYAHPSLTTKWRDFVNHYVRITQKPQKTSTCDNTYNELGKIIMNSYYGSRPNSASTYSSYNDSNYVYSFLRNVLTFYDI